MELIGSRGFAAWQVYLNVSFYIPFSQTIREADFASLEIERKEKDDEKYTRDDWGKDEAIEWMRQQSPEVRALVFVDCLGQVYLDQNDLIKLVSVHKDANGIPYSRHSVESLTIKDASQLVRKTLEACFQASSDGLFF